MTIENTTRDVVKLVSENPAVRARALKLLPLYICTLPSIKRLHEPQPQQKSRKKLAVKIQLLHKSSKLCCWKHLRDGPLCYETQCIDAFLHWSVTMTIMEIRPNRFHYTRGKEKLQAVYMLRAQAGNWTALCKNWSIWENPCQIRNKKLVEYN